MKNFLFPELALDDLVFEYRNHAYGAFAIRKNYDKNMSVGFGLAVLIFVIAFLTPGLEKLFSKNPLEIICPEEFIVNEVIVNPLIQKVVVIDRIEEAAPIKSINAPKPDAIPKIVSDHIDLLKVSANAIQDNATISINDNFNSGSDLNLSTENSGNNGNFVTGANTLITNSSEEIFTVVEELPEFGQDASALSKYLRDKVRYTQIAYENGIEGKVLIEFIIDKNGEVRGVRLLRGIGGGCDEQAIKAIQQMPKWKPGRHSGKAVNVKMVLPVSFKLN